MTMPTDIESLAKELQQLRAAALTDLDSEKWEAIAAHVLRLCADAELRGLVAARACVLDRLCADRIGNLIADHHTKWEKPKCEHKRLIIVAESKEADTVNAREGLFGTVRCGDCGATRQRGWVGDWKEAGK